MWDEAVLVNWHAGEPLVVGVRRFAAMLDLFRDLPARTAFHHSVQTNGTLIDSAFAELFRQHDVSVGVSIDGPEHINDAVRVKRNGAGSFHGIMRGIQKLRDSGAQFTTLSVVSERSIDRIEEILVFLRGIGSSSVAFNMDEREGVNAHSSLDHLSYGEACAFWRRLIAAASSMQLTVREIDRALCAIYFPHNTLPNPNVKLGSFITVGAAGSVTSFSPELFGQESETYAKFEFGNIWRNTLPELLSVSAALDLEQAIRRGTDRCQRECEYFGLCGGGWPSNKFSEHGRFDVAETRMCRFMVKALVDSVLELGSDRAISSYFRSRMIALVRGTVAPQDQSESTCMNMPI